MSEMVTTEQLMARLLVVESLIDRWRSQARGFDDANLMHIAMRDAFRHCADQLEAVLKSELKG